MSFKTTFIAILTLLLGIFAFNAFTQASSTDLDVFEAVTENKTMINGYIWKTLSSIQKKVYLQGYNDALKTVQLYNIPDEENVTADLQEEFDLFSNISLDEIIAKLEQFYTNNDNLPIPISYALLVARNQLKGYGKDALEEYVIYLRRIFPSKE